MILAQRSKISLSTTVTTEWSSSCKVSGTLSFPSTSALYFLLSTAQKTKVDGFFWTCCHIRKSTFLCSKLIKYCFFMQKYINRFCKTMCNTTLPPFFRTGLFKKLWNLLGLVMWIKIRADFDVSYKKVVTMSLEVKILQESALRNRSCMA